MGGEVTKDRRLGSGGERVQGVVGAVHRESATARPSQRSLHRRGVGRRAAQRKTAGILVVEHLRVCALALQCSQRIQVLVVGQRVEAG